MPLHNNVMFILKKKYTNLVVILIDNEVTYPMLPQYQPVHK